MMVTIMMKRKILKLSVLVVVVLDAHSENEAFAVFSTGDNEHDA